MKRPIMLLSVLLIITIIIIIINTKASSALVRINEIMYNPAGEDDNAEYVEIYFDENTNFSNFLIGDLASNDTLKLIKNNKNNNNNNNNFVLIVEENFDYNNTPCLLYSAGKNIGNGLGNKGDAVFLFNENKRIIDKITYTNNYANGNGKSLSLVNGFWLEQEPSPCKENMNSEIGENNNNNNNDNDFNNNSNNNNNNNNEIKIGVSIKIKDDEEIDNNNTNNQITSSTVFESKNQNINKLIPYFVITVLLLISIVLIWRR